ncbi:MAG: hypothetical protein M1594_01260 [Candidatus Marsarchaeota archaeon]|nr:hypothetical protein [Candidatus Marsarchaeota archaeon]
MALLNSKLFFKVYGWLFLTFTLLSLAELFGIASRITIIHPAWQLRDVIIFLAFVSLNVFLYKYKTTNLEEFFKPSKRHKK